MKANKVETGLSMDWTMLSFYAKIPYNVSRTQDALTYLWRALSLSRCQSSFASNL